MDEQEEGQEWDAEVKLNGNGFGGYHGLIRNDPFIKPLGYKESFTISITSQPITRQRSMAKRNHH